MNTFRYHNFEFIKGDRNRSEVAAAVRGQVTPLFAWWSAIRAYREESLVAEELNVHGTMILASAVSPQHLLENCSAVAFRFAIAIGIIPRMRPDS